MHWHLPFVSPDLLSTSLSLGGWSIWILWGTPLLLAFYGINQKGSVRRFEMRNIRSNRDEKKEESSVQVFCFRFPPPWGYHRAILNRSLNFCSTANPHSPPSPGFQKPLSTLTVPGIGEVRSPAVAVLGICIIPVGSPSSCLRLYTESVKSPQTAQLECAIQFCWDSNKTGGK